jgi:hypothetical protein
MDNQNDMGKSQLSSGVLALEAKLKTEVKLSSPVCYATSDEVRMEFRDALILEKNEEKVLKE